MVNRFVRTERVNKGKSQGRPSVIKMESKYYKLYSLGVSSVQELRPEDFESRRYYCNWFLQNRNEDRMLDLSFYFDETWFYLSEYVSSQNFRY